MRVSKSTFDFNQAQVPKTGATHIPVKEVVNQIILKAKDSGATDILIEPREDDTLVSYKINSRLEPVLVLNKEIEKNVVSRVKVIAYMDPEEKMLPQAGRFSFSHDNRTFVLGAATLPVIHGEQVILRLS